MDLETAQRLVYASAPDDWVRWGNAWPNDQTQTDFATYRHDVALVLRWGPADGDVSESWTDKFTDHRARSFQVEALYGGARVLQAVLVATDGGRYCLPMAIPYPLDDGGCDWRIFERDLAIPRLLHGLAMLGGSPDEGVDIAGLVVVNRPDWSS